jgi:hypothetical protein
LAPPERRMKPGPGTAPAWRWVRATSSAGAMPSEGIQGDERGAWVALARMTGTNAGSPTGRESHGDTGPVVVAGVTPRQGGRESRPQGEGGQAVKDSRMPGGMRNACDMRSHVRSEHVGGDQLLLVT